MAAGVGKTYAMLEEGHDRLREGEDVVIGWLESHGRAETAAMAEGIEVVPPREVVHRGITLREMDTAAVIARRPGVALVDELAHTNAPDSAPRQALLRRRGPAPRRDRRDLDGERPAPGEPQRPRLRAHRGAGARDDPRRRPARCRRGRAGGPHPRGAPGAPSRGQGLSRRSGRRGAAQLLHRRQPGHPARGRPAGGRGSGRRAHAPRPPRPERRRRAGSHRRAGDGGDAPERGAQRLVRTAWRAARRLGGGARRGVHRGAHETRRRRASATWSGASP